MQFNRAIVLADSGDLPPEQMLVAVTRPLEEAAYGVIGVNLVRSTTTRGSAEIDVTFNEGTDPVSSFQLLNAALGRGPRGAARRYQGRCAPADQRRPFRLLDISLSSRVRDLAELTDIAQYDLAPSLHRIAGVYRVETVGAKYREYVVRLDPARMLQHKLTPQDVVAGPGQGQRDRIGRARARRASHAADGGNHGPARGGATRGGADRKRRRAADLHARRRQRRTRHRRGLYPHGLRTWPRGAGRRVAAARRQYHAHLGQAHAIVDDFRARYPDVSFSFSYDQATLVQESFNSVRDAIILGLILAVAVVYGFTRSPLSALIAAVVVPCTIPITFAVMSAIGMTFNMMTLGGLAAGIGLFIDDAIVMIEAIHRAHAGGTGAQAAVQNALAELTRPLIASTATVIVVFLPLVFLSGVTGVFFRALAFTLGERAGGFAVLALYFTPALEVLVERWRGPGAARDACSGLVQRGYVLSLRPFIRIPLLALIVAAASLAAAAMLYRTIGTDYLPQPRRGRLHARLHHPAGKHARRYPGAAREDRRRAQATPEVAAFSRRTGTQLGFFLTESNRGDISVLLKRKRTRDIDRDHGLDAAPHPGDRARRPDRVLPGAPGPDRRSFRHAGTDRDQGLWRRSGDDRGHRPRNRRSGCADPGFGRSVRRAGAEQSGGRGAGQPDRGRTLRAFGRRSPRGAQNGGRGYGRDSNCASAIG